MHLTRVVTTTYQNTSDNYRSQTTVVTTYLMTLVTTMYFTKLVTTIGLTTIL